MLGKKTLDILRGSRTVRTVAVGALMATSIAMGAGPVGASTPNATLLIAQKQAAADAAMRSAGIGPSLGASASTGR